MQTPAVGEPLEYLPWRTHTLFSPAGTTWGSPMTLRVSSEYLICPWWTGGATLRNPQSGFIKRVYTSSSEGPRLKQMWRSGPNLKYTNIVFAKKKIRERETTTKDVLPAKNGQFYWNKRVLAFFCAKNYSWRGGVQLHLWTSKNTMLAQRCMAECSWLRYMSRNPGLWVCGA